MDEPAGAQERPAGVVHGEHVNDANADVKEPTALRMQESGLEAPKKDCAVPAGQGRQAAADAAPGLGPYLPWGQLVQDGAPASENVPAAQVVQVALLLAAVAALAVPAGHGVQAARLLRPGVAASPHRPAGQR